MGSVQITGPAAGPTVVERSNLVVETRKSWGEDWVSFPYLHPLTATSSIAPGISSAEFIWRYGNIKREDSSIFSNVSPISISDQYIRIVVIDSDGRRPIWTGIVSDESFSMHGTLPGGNPQGDQRIVAYGLEHLLDRVSVDGAYVEEQGATKKIGWSPTFNDRGFHGAALEGNRSTSIGPEGVHRFSRDGSVWNHREIIEYIFKYYSVAGLPFSFGGQYTLLESIKTVVNFEGLTIRQVLNKLIDRKRGLGWTIRISGGIVVIHVFSVFDESLSVGDVVVTPNSEVGTIAFDDAIDLDSALINKSVSSQYDRIVVQGERIKTCFSVSIADGNLEKGWVASEEASYKAGSVSNNLDSKRNDAERKTDKFNRVYQTFRIPSNWNWKASDGVGGNKRFVVPGLTSDGLVSTLIIPNTWNYPKALLRWLPISKNVNASNSEPEYLEPIVIVKDGQDFYQVDALAAIKKDPASVRILDREMGISVTPKINHVLGLNHFNKTTDPRSDTDPQIDYTSIIATVAVEADHRLRVEVDLVKIGEASKTLVLEVADAELWWINPLTVTGIKDGKLVKSNGGIVRDDSVRLRQIAAFAKAWYGKRRSSIEFTAMSLAEFSPVGSLIVSAVSGTQEEPVGTVVSEKTWDFERQSTRIKTDYAEIDIGATLDIPGMSDFRSVGRQFAKQKAEIKSLRKHVGNFDVRKPTAFVIADPSAGKSVDFILDDFNRPDVDTLGDGWIDGEFYGIRNGAARERHPLLFARPLRVVNDTSYLNFPGLTPMHVRGIASIIPSITTLGDTEVRARDFLSSQDGTLKVGFTEFLTVAGASSTFERKNYNNSINLFFRGNRKTGSGLFLTIAIIDGFGLVSESRNGIFDTTTSTTVTATPEVLTWVDSLDMNDNNSYVLYSLRSYQSGITTQGVIQENTSLISPSVVFANAGISHILRRIGTSDPSVDLITVTPEQTDYTSSALVVSGQRSVAGVQHTLEVNFVGTAYTIKLDGTAIISGVQSNVLNGRDVGLIATKDLVASQDYIQIDYFKAWIDGTTEPALP